MSWALNTDKEVCEDYISCLYFVYNINSVNTMTVNNFRYLVMEELCILSIFFISEDVLLAMPTAPKREVHPWSRERSTPLILFLLIILIIFL